MSNRQLAFALALSLFGSSAAHVTGQQDLPDELRAARMAGDTARALAILDGLADDRVEPGQRGYLRARTLAAEGNVDGAAALLGELVVSLPESRWRAKLSFARAELLADLGRWREAEAIWEAEANRLASDERKGELAAIYLRLADARSVADEPVTPDEQDLDFERARALYEKVLDLDAPHDARERATFRIGVCLEELSRFPDAVRAYERYAAAFDPADPAFPAQGRPGAHVFEVRLRLGRCQRDSGRPAEARRTWEDLDQRLQRALGGRADDEALLGLDPAAGEEIAGDAAYSIASTWSADVALAIAALERFLAAHPDHRRAPLAASEIPGLWTQLGRHERALESFEAFLDRPVPPDVDAELVEEIETLRRRALFRRGHTEFQLGRYDDAAATWSEYVARHPSGADWTAAQSMQIDAHFFGAAEEQRSERWAAARERFAAFIQRYPLHHRAADVGFRIGVVLAAQARASDDAAGFERAIDAWRQVAQKYAGQNAASQALFAIGETYETELGRLEEAIAAYRECTFGTHRDAAMRRLEVMTKPSLAIVTERTWRSNEPIRIDAKLRNVASVEVALYELDLEAYFRKHLTNRRVEELDLDLIAPDRTFTFDVPDYRDWAPFDEAIELAVEGPGVWAVAVTAGQLRATTLVVQSDVELIAKTSRSEVFVFAQDMLASAPAAGVRVLAAFVDGSEAPALLEAETDADGVVRFESERLAAAGEVRLFAARAGHCASNGLTLGELVPIRPLTDRGVVLTDRPAYPPGSEVRWRAILREVSAGGFTFEPGARYDVALLDPRGRTLARRALELSRFGTLHGAFQLDPFAPTGTWQVHCQRPNGPLLSGAFEVATYELAKVELTLEPARRVWYRGETVAVRVTARHYYGEPVVGERIDVGLPDGRVIELETDADGTALLEYPTRDHTSEGALAFSAHLRAENVRTTAQAWLAQRGFALELATGRDVRLVGETFGVDVRARTPAGDPVERDLVLVASRREHRPDGRIVEREVLRREIATDAAGFGSATLAFDDGGDHVLRVEGTDRFGNPVVAERFVQVSGDDDPLQLRLLCDRTTVDVGETFRLNLHARVERGLALVTIEAGRVLTHRLVRVRAGANEIEVPIGHEHWPNVAVAAALMDRNRFHEAAVELAVRRSLAVRIEPERDVYSPGEEARVRVVVRDQLGNPVACELSLAVVDDALFGLYPRTRPPIGQVFAPPVRHARSGRAALPTASTCTFRYEGVTFEIAAEILAEARRVEDAKRWEAEREEGLKALAAADSLAANEPALDQDALGRAAGGGPLKPTSPRGAPARQAARLRAADEAAPPPPPDGPLEDTAHWAPAVVTDADGEATIAFRWPERSTRWRLTAVGVGAQTLVGEADTTCTTRAELFGDLRLPAGLVAGDRPRLVARIHNPNRFAGRAEVRLRVGAEADRVVQSRTIDLDERPTILVPFSALEPLAAGRDVPVELELTAFLAGSEARVLNDLVRHSIDVRPRGLEHVDSASGVALSQRTLRLELPPDCRDRRLALKLALGVDQVLIDAIRGAEPIVIRCPPPPTRAQTATELFGDAALLAWLRGLDVLESELAFELSARVEGRVAELVATQQPDGSWPWIGGRDSRGGSIETSALALIALAEARATGAEVPAMTVEAGLGFLGEAVRKASEPSADLEALVLYATARHGQGDFGVANRLQRSSASLSPAALAWLALALGAMERGPAAAEIGALLEARADEPLRRPGARPSCAWPVGLNDAWHRSSLETVALAVLALEAALPGSERIEQGLEFLVSQRPWFGRGRGLALAALARQRARVRPAQERARVVLRVNGAPAGTFELGPDARSHALEIGIPDDAPRIVKVEVERAGDGEPHVAAVLRGFSTDEDARPERLGFQGEFRVGEHSYAAAHPRYAGRAVNPGFGRVRHEGRTWTNEIEHLGLGHTTRSYVSIGRSRGTDDFLVLEVPLPAGTRVLEGSVQGGSVLAWEVQDGRLIVHLGQGSSGVSYELVGIVPGAYEVGPAVLWSLGRPDRRTWNRPTRLTVLAAGEASPDEYRPTPDELYEIGRLAFEAEDWDVARANLTALDEGWGPKLERQALKETARMLMFLAIRADDSAGIVRHFEVLTERYPELLIPFEDVRRVGRAYRELEEFERSASIFRAMIEGTFGKDLKVAGALEELGERAGALATLDRLYLEFPDFPTVLQTRLATCDKRLTWAPGASNDASLRRAELDRAALSFGAIRDLRAFLAAYPDDPIAPEAGLNLVSAHLEIDDYETASRLAGEMAARWTEPEYADAFGYTRAVAEWYLGRDDVALGLLKAIAGAEYVDERGRSRPSPNRDLALYILGQIHHARREVADAVAYYDRVDELFTDAREALAGLREKEVSLEELTTVKPGESVELAVTHKNVARVDLLVYAVDLLTLALREKNLADIAGIELAGISPTIRRTVELGESEQLFGQETKVALELPDPGAYLVLCRGGERFSSGLVLVSDLELEVEEDPAQGRLRVQAVGPDERFVRDVDVRVIGSADSTFQSGRTDPRGLFVADGVNGAATVIARLGTDHYAFHRGRQALGVQAGRPIRRPGGEPQTPDYLQNVIELNRAQQAVRQNRLDDEIRRESKGVRVDQVK